MGVDDDSYDDNDDEDDVGFSKKPNLQTRLHSGLQVIML